jgi:heme/copper-type cytochrome/quinol oxidase subunit 3
MPNGLGGAALFVAGEAALFGTLLASYYYLRFHTSPWPPAGIEKPSVALPLALTGALVLTSVPMALASRAARAGRHAATWWMLALAVVVQGGYLGAQIYSFFSDLDKFSPTDTAYGSVYFTMLGAHHIHVLLGIILNAWLVGRIAFGLTNYRVVGVRVVALYWHFVNAVAVLIVLTQINPSL